MNNQDYFIERYYRSLSSILNDKKQINKLSAYYINNHFEKIEKLLESNEESVTKEQFLNNHYIIINDLVGNQTLTLYKNTYYNDDEKEVKLVAKRKLKIKSYKSYCC